jgi:NhaC family Na+:H+ antiporter
MNELAELKKRPSPWLAAAPVVALAGLLYVAAGMFGGDILEGASQVALLTATGVCTLLATVFCGTRWKEIEEAIVRNIAGVAQALLILLLIGALSGTWMVSGVIPAMVDYGMMVIRPDFYLASACVICAVVSVVTGSSWTTVATVGVALAGIGLAQGFSPGWIGGAIISGAYFGDKISPLSDTTVLAAAVTRTPLFVHIRYMMVTTVPAIALALAVYAVAGLTRQATATADGVAAFSDALRSAFYITPWLLLAPVATGFLVARRTPPVVTLFLGCLAACVCALVFQPHVLEEVSGAGSRFRGLLMSVYGTTSVDTGHATLNRLVATRGMGGMMPTVWLIICAMCFGGAMTASGMMASLVSVFLRFMGNTAGIVASTVFSGVFLNVCTSDQYLSILLTGDMYRDIYRRRGYESRLLSRTTEDGATVTSPLIPWNTCGMTQATVLGIPTLTYLPYAIFNIASPLVSIAVAAIGYRIKRTVRSIL